MQHNFASPVAEFYNHAVPEFARDGVHNVISNLNKPVTFGNDMLQGGFGRARGALVRITLNSTLGVGGLVDVATKMGIPDHSSDFGLTLGAWALGEGPYLVLPLLGPGPPRDLGGQVVDIFMDPLSYTKFQGSDTWTAARAGVGTLDTYAQNVEYLEKVERTSIDDYAAARSLYRQYRAARIHDDDTSPVENAPNL
ncbi:MAG: VacJ family lipoprotein [Alphaproteobacteria bacterium]|nr:VacJ family lipoprotein [Alphaproteobacteria bacterium]MDE2493015.1 VacJ family lipoprotein [Alphaproteobacteria bacterium]